MKRTFFNLIEKLKKPLHILTAFAVIICTAFTVPCFATSYDFSSYALPYIVNPTADDIRGSGILLFHNELASFYFTSPYQYVYYFIYLDGDTYRLTFVSGTESYYAQRADDGTYIQNVYLSIQDADTGVYYKRSSYDSRDAFPSDILVFNSLADGLSAFSDYIDNASKSIQNVPYWSSGSSSFGYQFASDVSGKSYYVNEQNNNFACCAVLNGSLICGSLYSSANINTGYNTTDGYIGSPMTLNSVSVSDGTLYYGTINYSDTTYSSYLKTYTDANTCYSALYEYLVENGGSVDVPSVWVNKPLTIPQGYAAVINTSDMTAGKGSFRLRANTGNLGNSNLWRDVFGNDNIQSGQAIYNTNTAITSYDFDEYPQLTWSPYEYSLVRATAYEYIGEATKSNTYTYIFNPIQSNATSIKTGQNTNSYITLYMNEQFDGSVKLYPLTSMAALGQGQTIEVGNDESDNSGSGDISSGTWTNSDGYVYTPPQGGGNGTGSSQNPLESIAGTVEHLGEVLNQFVGGLSTILTAPVEAIQTLINNGSAFVSQLSGLYSWLPAQVYSTLTSAIVLCITIGVLKVLL